MSLDEDLSSVTGPLLASLSAFWLRVSENVSSLKQREASEKAFGLMSRNRNKGWHLCKPFINFAFLVL